MASVKVDFAKKTATVTCEDEGCDPAAMVAALKKAGYGATVSDAGTPP